MTTRYVVPPAVAGGAGGTVGGTGGSGGSGGGGGGSNGRDGPDRGEGKWRPFRWLGVISVALVDILSPKEAEAEQLDAGHKGSLLSLGVAAGSLGVAALPAALAAVRAHAAAAESDSSSGSPDSSAREAELAAEAPQDDSSAPSSIPKLRRIVMFIEPSPFTYTSGYQTRFLATIKEMVEAGCQVLVVTPGEGRRARHGPDGRGFPMRRSRGLENALHPLDIQVVTLALTWFHGPWACRPRRCGAAARWLPAAH